MPPSGLYYAATLPSRKESGVNIFKVILDVLTPGHPAHEDTLRKMYECEIHLSKNLLLLGEPFNQAVMAATDEAAEFSNVGKH